MSEIRGNEAFLKTLRVALVHDWLTGMRGGEKCLEIFCEIFPQADLYTLFHFPGTVSPTIEGHPIQTTWIQHLPFLAAKYRNYLPLFPLAMEGLSFKGYDLVLSSSHCVAKAARAQSPTKHISYVFTPIRYVWDMYDIYFGRESKAGHLPKLLMPLIAPLFRKWDIWTCRRVDYFIADSDHVRKRIRRYYQREAEVIPVPVDTGQFHPGRRASGILPDGHSPGPLQAGRPGGPGLQSLGNSADYRGKRPAARTAPRGIQEKYHLVRVG